MTTRLGKVPGNSSVVQLLSRALDRANEGDINYCVVVLCSSFEAMRRYAGASEMREVARERLLITADELKEVIANDVTPLPDPGLDESYWCYELPKAPASFDFVHWLIDADMTRRRAGIKAPLKVAFWRGRDGMSGLKTPLRKQMFEHVLRPALALMGAVEDEKALRGHRKHQYVVRDIIAAYNKGENVPMFPKLRPVLDGCPVTITLREADHFPHRNSNLVEWFKVANELQRMGETVIFIRDTAKADEPLLADFPTCPTASRELLARVALYQHAKANLFVGNGPCALATFTDRPYLIVSPMDEPESKEEYSYGTIQTPEVWNHLFGQAVGVQLPWAAPDQRIVWQPDTCEIIMQEYRKWIMPRGAM